MIFIVKKFLSAADPDDDGISNLNEYPGGTDPIVYEESNAPNTPVLSAPVNRETVGLSPQLQIEEFYDPDFSDANGIIIDPSGYYLSCCDVISPCW